MKTLYPYQKLSLEMLEKWFVDHKTGNPVLVIPTGGGKSLIIAEFCKDALQNWPETRVLMLTHQQELIQQNTEELLDQWPNAPLGIYSAGLKKRVIDEPITFAGIGSVYKRAQEIGHVDIIKIDEAHLINNEQNGRYRHLIKELKIINPYLRVIGYSATPYRLGQGMLTEGTNALFSDIIEPVTVSHLIAAGYLCELRSKSTSTKLDVSGVHKRGGEFIESELQAAVNDELTNVGVVNEILRRGEGRKAGIIFASGILHAQELNRLLLEHDEKSAIVTGTTPKKERTQIFTDFKSGELRFLVNVKVATTGFNHKGIDLIADVQPTLSPGLYVQKAGRGLRIHPDKTDCLVLDFAGNINTHGPITNITPPKPKGVQEGEAPVKVCPECDEVIHISVMVCPSCGYEFPIAEATFKLSNADIMGRDNALEMEVSQWHWSVHTSSTSGKELLKVQYYGKNLSDPVVAEFLCIGYEGYPGKKAWRVLTEMAVASGADTGATGLSEIVGVMQAAPQPTMIKYQKDGKYYRVTDRSWEPVQSELALTA